MRFIPVSFNQAIGATTPLFTAILGFLMKGTRESFGTYLALVPVVMGIVIATGFEPSFHLVGFIVCVSATALRGFKTVFQVPTSHIQATRQFRMFRASSLTCGVSETCCGTCNATQPSCLQGILLSEPAERMDSFSLLAYMSPFATLWLIPAVMVLEPRSPALVHVLMAENTGFVHLVALSCIMAFFANLLNFLITKHTSPLTLQVRTNTFFHSPMHCSPPLAAARCCCCCCCCCCCFGLSMHMRAASRNASGGV
jgi:drug/metabolite transporter (DMT)-like permease